MRLFAVQVFLLHSASVRLLSVFDLFVISCVANDYLSVGSDTLGRQTGCTTGTADFGSADGSPATALLLYWHLCLHAGTQSHNQSGSVQSVMPLYWTSH